MSLEWRYNVVARRWQATDGNHLAVVERWASGAEWTAFVAADDHDTDKRSAGVMFKWAEDAWAWCDAALASYLLPLPDVVVTPVASPDASG
jgi:hypothetical protein